MYWIGGKKRFLYYPYAKWLNTTKVPSQGAYITAGGVARNKFLPTPACIQHYPMMLTANGCDSNAVTWQQAQALGLLPADYLNCTECVPHNRFYVQSRDMNFEHLEHDCNVDVSILAANDIVAEEYEIDCMADLGYSL